MELIRKNEQYMEIISSGSERITVEGDVIVPDVKPDVLKVLQVDANSLINNKEITNGGFYVEGKLNVNILYLPDSKDQCTGCIKASFDFRDRFNKDGISDGMKLRISANVTKIEFNLLNSRKLSIKAVVLVKYEFIGMRELELPCAISEGLGEYKTKTLLCDRLSADETSDFIIRDSMEIPQGKVSIKEIIKTDARISQREKKAVSGKLIAKGELCINVLYRTTDDAIDCCEGTFPFTEVFDAYDLMEDDNVCLELDVGDISSDLSCDNDGDLRIINFECLINAHLRGERVCETEMIYDCYFPYKKTDISYREEELRLHVWNTEEQKSIKEILSFENKTVPITRIYNVISEIEILKTEITNSNVSVESKLRVYIMYFGENNHEGIYTLTKDIPINYLCSNEKIKEGMNAKINIIPDHIAYNINSMGEIELRCCVNYNVKIFENKKIKFVDNVVCEDCIKNSGITIYFVKNGDTLWDIAKHYSVKVCDIIDTNSLADDTVVTGQKLIIPA